MSVTIQLIETLGRAKASISLTRRQQAFDVFVVVRQTFRLSIRPIWPAYNRTYLSFSDCSYIQNRRSKPTFIPIQTCPLQVSV